MSPKGYFISIIRNLSQARDLRGLEAYVTSDQFRVAFDRMPAAYRFRASQSVVEAMQRCQPKMPRAGSVKANWKDPAMVARFRQLCSQGKTDAEIASICRITVGAAQRARSRYFRGLEQAPFALAA